MHASAMEFRFDACLNFWAGSELAAEELGQIFDHRLWVCHEVGEVGFVQLNSFALLDGVADLLSVLF